MQICETDWKKIIEITNGESITVRLPKPIEYIKYKPELMTFDKARWAYCGEPQKQYICF